MVLFETLGCLSGTISDWALRLHPCSGQQVWLWFTSEIPEMEWRSGKKEFVSQKNGWNIIATDWVPKWFFVPHIFFNQKSSVCRVCRDDVNDDKRTPASQTRTSQHSYSFVKFSVTWVTPSKIDDTVRQRSFQIPWPSSHILGGVALLFVPICVNWSRIDL